MRHTRSSRRSGTSSKRLGEPRGRARSRAERGSTGSRWGRRGEAGPAHELEERGAERVEIAARVGQRGRRAPARATCRRACRRPCRCARRCTWRRWRPRRSRASFAPDARAWAPRWSRASDGRPRRRLETSSVRASSQRLARGWSDSRRLAAYTRNRFAGLTSRCTMPASCAARERRGHLADDLERRRDRAAARACAWRDSSVFALDASSIARKGRAHVEARPWVSSVGLVERAVREHARRCSGGRATRAPRLPSGSALDRSGRRTARSA
jgi:hypothetical protein